MDNLIPLALMLALGFCVMPGIIASARGAQHAAPIWFLGIVGGWTVVGWVAAFIWACVSPVGERGRKIRRTAKKYRRTHAHA